jgi:hypothetical protein
MARRSGVAETPDEQARDPAHARYRVRWAVEGRECCQSCAAKALADALLGILKDAAHDGTPFGQSPAWPPSRHLV